MRKSITSMVFWLTLLSVGLMVPEHAGAIGPIISSGPGLDPPLRVASTVGVVPLSGTGNGANMLQFKAGGHILGFQPNKVYLAGLDHALSAEFLGTDGVMPTSAATAPPSDNASRSPALSTVVYRNLWEGIDLTYESTEGGIAESTYHVAPGSDPSRILLRYNLPVELQGDGSLRVRFERGTLTESPPVAWQEIEGSRVPVKAEFRVAGNEVGFVVGPYDRSQVLIIDPTLEWHTFQGSSGYDGAYGIALDGGGNVYVTGLSSATWGTPLHAHGGDVDIFVLKLDSNGVYQWHSFYGSSAYNYAGGIAVDINGNVYVSGYSDATWGTPLHAHCSSGMGADAFVLKLDSNGAYLWNTFYGSCRHDSAFAIALDGVGNVYVTGLSNASWGVPLHPHSGTAEYEYNVFVLKLDSNGVYQWHTFHGTGVILGSRAIVVDGDGNVYVAGESLAWGTPLHAQGGGLEIFVLKLDSGGAYQWHTFYGSSSYDYASGIAVDGDGNVYVTGCSAETWGSPLHAHHGGYDDIVVLKLDSSGAYQWHTFYGSVGGDFGRAIHVDGGGDVYVSGKSDGTWGFGFPIDSHSGKYDAFTLRLDTSGAYQWHSFHGSGENDEAYGIAVDGGGNVFVAGDSEGPWGSPLNAYAGASDLFVLRLSKDPPETGSLVVSIRPQSAAEAGARWRVDCGDWRSSDTTLSGLPAGSHTVEFNDIMDWYRPENQVVSILENQTTMASCTYVPREGALSVTIVPQGAVDAGAQWRVDGGPWQQSGVILPGVGVGQHTVEFKQLSNWTRPANQTVTIVEFQTATTSGSYALLPAIGLVDFNGDIMGDILWRHTGGALSFWQMDGLTVKRIDTIPPIDPSWKVAALGDFNGDGMTDIFWRHTGGMIYTWLMSGATPIGFGLQETADLSWYVVGAADFGADPKYGILAGETAEILWRDTAGNIRTSWNYGLWWARGIFLWQADLSWQVEALADFNGDSKADILWRHTSGMLYLQLMNYTSLTGAGSPGSLDLNWSIASAADFTGDGKADILWRHTSGLTAIWQMDGLQLIDFGIPGVVDPSWSIAYSHDLNADGKADILWRHGSGATYLWLMNGFTRIGEGSLGFVDPSWKIENK